MAKKRIFGKRKSTAAAAAQRMMLGGLPQEEEELMQSPARMVVQSFVHDKVAMTGLILFLLIFLCCIILPFFFPIQICITRTSPSPTWPRLRNAQRPFPAPGQRPDGRPLAAPSPWALTRTATCTSGAPSPPKS